jgi:hypothetical protein
MKYEQHVQNVEDIDIIDNEGYKNDNHIENLDGLNWGPPQPNSRFMVGDNK